MPSNGASAKLELFGTHLANLYEKHFQETCGVSEYSGDRTQPTECVRFMMAASEAMDLGRISASAVVKNVKRWKQNLCGDNAVPQ